MLKPYLDGWNLVLSGHWDALILTPAWVGAHVADGHEVHVELPAVAALPPRLCFADIHILVVDNKLLVGTRKADDHSLQTMQRTALRLLHLLPHTPLTACGVNFAFIEESPGALAQVLKPDTRFDLKRAKLELTGSTLRHSCRLGQQQVNLTVESRDDSTLLSYNFHFDAQNSSMALQHLDGKLLTLKNTALELSQALFTVGIDLPS